MPKAFNQSSLPGEGRLASKRRHYSLKFSFLLRDGLELEGCKSARPHFWIVLEKSTRMLPRSHEQNDVLPKHYLPSWRLLQVLSYRNYGCPPGRGWTWNKAIRTYQAGATLPTTASTSRILYKYLTKSYRKHRHTHDRNCRSQKYSNLRTVFPQLRKVRTKTCFGRVSGSKAARLLCTG